MTEEQARLLFLDHCQPGNRGALERHGERPAVAAILAALTPPAEPVSRPAGEGDDRLRALADRVVAEVKRGASGSSLQALGALSNIEAMVLAALQPGGER